MEEAKKRDHRKIGKELDLFMIAPEGPGFPFFLAKGMVLRNVLEDFWRKKHEKEVAHPLVRCRLHCRNAEPDSMRRRK